MEKMAALTYRQLNNDQRAHADTLVYLLGKGLDDPIFIADDEKTVSAVCNIARDQVYSDTWGFFCYDHRVAFEKDAAGCCDGMNIYPVRRQDQADYLLSLKTLREQLTESNEQK